jgi:hypothetical protein
MMVLAEQAQKKSKTSTVDNWIAWFFEQVVSSPAAASDYEQGASQGVAPETLARRIYESALDMAASQASSYYSPAASAGAIGDVLLRARAVELLRSAPFPVAESTLERLTAINTIPGGQFAHESDFWGDTEPLRVSSTDWLMRELASAHHKDELTIDARNTLSERALAWVDAHQPSQALAFRTTIVDLEIARHIRLLEQSRSGVDGELVGLKVLALLKETAAEQMGEVAEPLGYLDRQIPLLVQMIVEKLVERDTEGFGVPL